MWVGSNETSNMGAHMITIVRLLVMSATATRCRISLSSDPQDACSAWIDFSDSQLEVMLRSFILAYPDLFTEYHDMVCASMAISGSGLDLGLQ